MKTKIFLLACFALVTSIFTYHFVFNSAYMPSTDFDEAESYLLVWSNRHEAIYTNFIKNLAEDEHVTLYVPKDTSIKTLSDKLAQEGVSMSNLNLVPVDNSEIWIRDFGPVFLENSNNKEKTLSFKYYKDNRFPYEYESITKENLKTSNMVSTGGGRELNGKGLAILVENHESYWNPKLSKEDITKELKRTLGVKKIIWLKSGIPQDDPMFETPLHGKIFTKGAGDHIDTFCRFISPTTILFAQVSKYELATSPIARLANKRIEENYNILKKATDQDGKPLQIIRVPMAPLIIEESFELGEPSDFVLPTSYLNFVITKNKVIVPGYASYLKTPEAIEKERETEEKFKSAFPGKKIVMLDCVGLNRFGGGFHCISINKPKKKKKIA